MDANVGALVRNSAFDQLLASVKAAQRVAAAKLVKKLLPKRPAPAVVGAGDAAAPDGAAMSDISEGHANGAATGAAAAAADAAPPSISLARTDSQSCGPLSPIETLFREHVVSRVLLPFEQAYQGLVAERARVQAGEMGERGSDASAAAAAAAAASSSSVAAAAGTAAAAVPSVSAPCSSTSLYDRALSRVVAAYERHLLDLPSAAFLEPIACTVTLHPGPAYGAAAAAAAAVPSGHGAPSAAQYRLQVHAWDDLGMVVRRLVSESRRPEHAAAGTQPLRCVSLDPAVVRFVLTGVGASAAAAAASAASSSAAAAAGASAAGGAAAHSFPPHLPLQLNRTPADCERALSDFFGADGVRQCSLEVRGGIEFELSPAATAAAAAAAAQLPAARCFVHTYRQGEADQRVDYFKCQQCALNCRSTSIFHPASERAEPRARGGRRGAESGKRRGDSRLLWVRWPTSTRLTHLLTVCSSLRCAACCLLRACCVIAGICKSCATSCHVGHALSPFMIAHKPTYAACYCNKKKACLIHKNK